MMGIKLFFQPQRQGCATLAELLFKARMTPVLPALVLTEDAGLSNHTRHVTYDVQIHFLVLTRVEKSDAEAVFFS